MPLWDVPKPYTNNGQWRGIEPYTRRITKPSQVLGQTDGVAQALVRYTEARALLGGTTCSQGVTLANAGGLTKFYAGLMRNPEAPDDERLPVAGTNIANPENGGARDYLDTLAGTPATSSTCRRAPTPPPAGGSTACRSTATSGPSTTGCARSTARRSTPTTSPCSPAAARRWCGRRSATTCCTAARPTSWPPSRPASRCASARTGRRAARRTCSASSRSASLASAEHGGVFTARELVEMVTINPARALKWDHLVGSIEPGKLADLVVLDGRDGDPFDQLVRARESSIALVVIGGVPRVGQRSLMRRFWDVSLTGADWIDEITIGRSARQLYLEQDDDLLDGLPLSTRRRHAARRDGAPARAGGRRRQRARLGRCRHRRRPGDVRRRHGGERRHVPGRPRLRGRGHGAR